MDTRFAAIRLLPVLLLVSGSCSTSEPEHVESELSKSVPGTYVAVSESEWSQELQLNADGTARLTNARWSPGDSQRALTHTYSGQWALEDDKITLRLLESSSNPERVPHTEQLRYVAELSLTEIGRTESLPGVHNLGPAADDSPLWRATMWRNDALRALKWP